MSNNVEISIVNLCYNTGRFLKETFDSIKNQTFQNFELIIVDDCSTDNSVDLINGWLAENPVAFQVHFLRNEKNKGIPGSLNRGLSCAKGRYYAMIADDRWDPTFLQTVYNLLNTSSEDVGMVYTKARMLSTASNEIIGELDPFWDWKKSTFPNKELLFQQQGVENLYRLSGTTLQEYLFFHNPIVSFTMLMKMSALKAAGLYDETQPDEDFPGWFKLTRNHDVLFLNATLATYIRHANSFTIKNTYALSKGHMMVLMQNSELARSKHAHKQLNAALFKHWLDMKGEWISEWQKHRSEAVSITMKLLRFSNGIRFKILKHFAASPKRRLQQLLKF